MKKIFKCTLIGMLGLSLIACDPTANADSDDRLATLETQVQSLQEENASLRSRISMSANSSASTADTDVFTLVKPSAIAKVSVDSASAEKEPKLYYDSVEELVKMYRTGQWDGWSTAYHRGTNRSAMPISSGGYGGELIEYEDLANGVYTECRTGIYPDLPEGKTPDDYIECRYNPYSDNSQTFTCIDYDGVHVYAVGKEVAFCPIEGITQEAEFVTFWNFPLGIKAGDRIYDLCLDGSSSVLFDSVIDLRHNDNSTCWITFNEGKVCYHTDSLYGYDTYTIIENDAVAVACTRYVHNLIFKSRDGYTYIVKLEDHDAIASIEAGKTDVIYQHCLGQEDPEYYIAFYEEATETYFEEWSRGENPKDPIECLLDRFEYNPEKPKAQKGEDEGDSSKVPPAQPVVLLMWT